MVGGTSNYTLTAPEHRGRGIARAQVQSGHQGCQSREPNSQEQPSQQQ